MISENDLKELKKRLPRGYFKTIVNKVTVSERTVSNFFSRKQYNLEVHQAAISVAEKYSQDVKAALNRQKSISHVN